MSSKSQQQPPMSWRNAAKQQKSQDKSSQQQPQQQQSNGANKMNGYKPDKNGSKNGSRGAPNGGASSTPNARPTTAAAPQNRSKGFMGGGSGSDGAGRLNAAAFDAANNMMPNFARQQQQYQPPLPSSQSSRSPYYQSQGPPPPYVKRSSMERNEAKTNGEPRNYEERNHQKRRDSPENESRQSTQTIRDENTVDERGSRNPTSVSNVSSNSSLSSVNSSSSSVNSGSLVNGSSEDGSSPVVDGGSQADSKMGKNRKTGSGASTPRNLTPTPSSTPTPPDVAPTLEEEESVATEMALVDPESVIKHPLKNKWAMWYFKNDKSKDWKENQRVLLSFDTIEDFWALYNHLTLPSNLASGCDFSMFKEGIQPMWEDASNVDGGRWLINSVKQHRQQVLDRLWLETLLCLIGEIFEDASDEVCGTVINVRQKGDKLAIWTRNAEDQTNNMIIGKGLRENLGLPHQMQLGFQVHKDTITKYGSITRNKYIA